MIKVQNLVKNFDKFEVLKGINMNVEKGKIYGLVGPNGAGKTTLIKHLVGVYKKNHGTIKIGGEDVFENNMIKNKIGYISDNVYYFSQATMLDMAKFYSEVYKKWSWERYKKTNKILKLDDNRKIKTFSKGMKKQVAFVLTIASTPEVYILDEPVDGLDPLARKKIWNILLNDVSNYNKTVLVSSHNLRELEDVCDIVGILQDGKILFERSLDDLRTDIHKIQVAFEKDFSKDKIKDLDVLNINKLGSVYTIIVKGREEKIKKELEKFKMLFFNSLPLSLEEVFIYEVGGVRDELEEIFS